MLKSSRKAQFFILSAFTIISILYFLSKWIAPTTIIDTSSIAAMDEPFIFNNIREKTFLVVNGSKNCDDLQYNLDEFRHYAENFVIEKNYIIKVPTKKESAPQGTSEQLSKTNAAKAITDNML